MLAHPMAAPGDRFVVSVFGPASLSNLGPGFDAVGLAIEGIGDVIEARWSETPGVSVEAGEGAEGVPLEPERNTAARAAMATLHQLESERGVVLRIKKGIRPGSGIGSSAASAVAGAWAVNVLHGSVLAKEDLVGAVLAGEQIASGTRHGDNVLPALFGGLVLVSSTEPERYRRLALPRPLPIALIQPDVRVLTKAARAMLPSQVPLRDAIHNASALAFLIDAFHAGDWETVGRNIMQDRLVEPVRATLLPCYEAVRTAALEAGAYGCALSGSGPAMFAIAETEEACADVLSAMQEACRCTGVASQGRVTRACASGAHTLSS
ncbi:MAG: homoserine kinase [Rhodothermales bacterium]